MTAPRLYRCRSSKASDAPKAGAGSPFHPFSVFLSFSFICLFLLSFFFLPLTGCRSDHGRIYWVDESRNVKIDFEKNDADFSGYKMNLINQQGIRVSLEEFQFGDSDINFRMEDDNIIKGSGYSLAEIVTAMGDKLPEYPERSAAVARVEIIPDQLAGNSGKVSYSQFAIPLLKSELLAAGQEVLVRQTIKMAEVSFQKVMVLDLESGLPIANASVISVISGSYKEEVSGQNIAAWKSELYRPIRALTDSSGEAILLPLSHELGDNSAYSIISWADGYCTYVSNEINLNDAEIPVIKLLKCSDADSSTIGFKTRFSGDYQVFNDPISGSDTVEQVGYISERSARIRVDSLSPIMRGIKVRITEKHIQDGEENPSIPLINYDDQRNPGKFKFYSDIVFNAPFLFSYNNQENGEFLVHIFSSFADIETSVNDSNQAKKFYFKKHTTAPDHSFMDSIKIRGMVQEGVISGQSGTRFFIDSDECMDGMEIGLAEIGGDPFFRPCINNTAIFEKSMIIFFEDADKSGGKKILNMYLKDRYKLVSVDDLIHNKNQMAVFIDYGTPDLQELPLTLGLDFGFTYHGSEKGTDVSPFEFASGRLNNGRSDTVIIRPSDSSNNVVLRSASPSHCKTNSGPGLSDLDGVNTDDRGRMINKWKIAKNEALLESGIWHNCSEDGLSVDIPVNSEHINFPENKSNNAEFVLKVMDAAGHESVAFRYMIPPCPTSVETTSGTAVCWEN